MSRRDHIPWTKFCSKHMSLFTFKVCLGSLLQINEAKMLLGAKSAIARPSESSGSGEEAGHRMSMSHRGSPISAMGFSPVSRIKVWAWMWGSWSELCPIFRSLYLGVRMNCLWKFYQVSLGTSNPSRKCLWGGTGLFIIVYNLAILIPKYDWLTVIHLIVFGRLYQALNTTFQADDGSFYPRSSKLCYYGLRGC